MEFNDNEIILDLLNEYKEQRDQLKQMIVDIEDIKSNIDKLFPKTLDQRYSRFFEEKVKTATGIFNTLLDIRKEVSKNLKDEIDIRSRLNKNAIEEDLESLFNIRELANKVEKLNKRKNKIIENKEIKEEINKEINKEQSNNFEDDISKLTI